MTTDIRFCASADSGSHQFVDDLNKLTLPEDFVDPEMPRPLETYNTVSADGRVRVFFRAIKENLIDLIEQADVIVGCVAWLTDFDILDALSRTQGVALIVQKEDFLRPDLGAASGWKADLRRAYSRLPSGPYRWDYEGILQGSTYCGDPTIAPVRCVGNYNREGKATFPRAHHKFAVFCRYEHPNQDCSRVTPYAAWTGSFNWTKNSGSSLENAVLLRDSTIVHAYYGEWQQTALLSEPLDWTQDWVHPEWRLGS